MAGIVPMIQADKIRARVRELAREISADYDGKKPVIIGVLKGAWIFMADLVRELSIQAEYDFIAVSSYGGESVSSGRVEVLSDISIPASSRHLILVEDIADTGRSIDCILKSLAGKKPASVRVCALLDKPGRREVDVPLHYRGFTIENKYVVGYGLDFNGMYRNLPYIGYIPGD